MPLVNGYKFSIVMAVIDMVFFFRYAVFLFLHLRTVQEQRSVRV